MRVWISFCLSSRSHLLLLAAGQTGHEGVPVDHPDHGGVLPDDLLRLRGGLRGGLRRGLRRGLRGAGGRAGGPGPARRHPQAGTGQALTGQAVVVVAVQPVRVAGRTALGQEETLRLGLGGEVGAVTVDEGMGGSRRDEHRGEHGGEQRDCRQHTGARQGTEQGEVRHGGPRGEGEADPETVRPSRTGPWPFHAPCPRGTGHVPCFLLRRPPAAPAPPPASRSNRRRLSGRGAPRPRGARRAAC